MKQLGSFTVRIKQVLKVPGELPRRPVVKDRLPTQETQVQPLAQPHAAGAQSPRSAQGEDAAPVSSQRAANRESLSSSGDPARPEMAKRGKSQFTLTPETLSRDNPKTPPEGGVSCPRHSSQRRAPAAPTPHRHAPPSGDSTLPLSGSGT